MIPQPSNSIKLATSDEEIKACFPIMSQLRRHLQEDKFISQVRLQMTMGYQLAFLQNYQIKGLAGFTISQSLSWGRYLYVADLAIDQNQRSQGYGTALFTWLEQYAQEQKCHQLHLDSGVQRFAAHRFYLQHKMNITSHHFVLQLNS